MKPRELKTEYLDLCALDDSSDQAEHKAQEAKLKKLVDMLRLKRKIVVVAGAGISVSAGSMLPFTLALPRYFAKGSLVPDFRSSTGLFNTLRSQHKLKASGKHLFDASVYRSDSSTSSFHDMVRELSHLTQNAKPTPFHHMLATIAEEGRLMRLYTQNVDGIDTALEPLATAVPLNKKAPWPKTVQLHGGLSKMVCTKCGHLSDFNGALFEGPEPPSCKECEVTDGVRVAGGLRSHGIGRLRPRMVLYNEFNPDEEAIGAVSHADLKSRPDAVIVVGTSLKVPGIRRLVKELCAVTRGRRGGCTAWINYDPEPVGIDVKDCWDLVIRGECDEVARHVGLPHWDDKDCGDYSLVSKEEPKVKSDFEVVLTSKTLDVVKKEGFLTPGASPRQQSPTPANGVAKSKQSQLPFGPKRPLGRPPKAKKKLGRKPLPSAPGEKITSAFGATKTSNAMAKQPAKTKSEEFQSTSAIADSMLLFPNLLKEQLKPVMSSPSGMTISDRRHIVKLEVVGSFPQSKSLELQSFKSQGQNQTQSTSSGAIDRDLPSLPQTPATPSGDGRGSPTFTETISPKGKVPHDMERLLS
jgi:NAD-dependent histone deacetylase SIR2